MQCHQIFKEPTMPHYTVTAAILIESGEILCMQRQKSKYDYVSFKYEFPGGKVEAGESNEEALMRELQEEMGIDITVNPDHFFMTIHHEYPDFSITMHTYLCPVSDRTFTRKEHANHVWLKPDELDKLDWTPADFPIIQKLKIYFNGQEGK